MRNVTPQVETREIADDDLDSISGGLGLGVGVDGLDQVLGAVAFGLPVGQITGLVSGAASTLTGATGLSGITSIAGL